MPLLWDGKLGSIFQQEEVVFPSVAFHYIEKQLERWLAGRRRVEFWVLRRNDGGFLVVIKK